MTEKVALITGATGQDGAYLAEFLLGKGYMVHGIKRRSSSFNSERVDHLYHDPHEQNVRFTLHYGDMTDATNLIRIVQETQPTEIYNLAARNHAILSTLAVRRCQALWLLDHHQLSRGLRDACIQWHIIQP